MGIFQDVCNLIEMIFKSIFIFTAWLCMIKYLTKDDLTQ